MELAIAIGLIKKGISQNGTRQVWADLGAGTGLFTNALATLLPPESTVYAIDEDQTALRNIQLHSNPVEIKTQQLNFLTSTLPEEHFDGILMANSLHFVKSKISFLQRLKLSLKPAKALLLIEYDTDTANPWVPYPISYISIQEMGKSNGFTVRKIGETNSVFRQQKIYSSVITF